LKYERILNSLKFGKVWLKDERIANVVQKSLHHRDGEQFDLIAYTIMPNHIHLVFIPVERDSSRSSQTKNKELSDINVALQKPVVTRIMRLLKGSTARKANEILNRTGQFWQHESYDHVIRNKEELHKTVNYILQNPVKAGLCESSDEWKWNYYNSKFLI